MARRTRAEMMDETRRKLLASARAAFAEKGFFETSMDDFTSAVGLTRGALYHHFGDKKGLFAAVVDQIDAEMAGRARSSAEAEGTLWAALLAEGEAYIEMALDPEVQRIVLRDGPAALGDPTHWPSQNRCLDATRAAVTQLLSDGVLRPVHVEAASRLPNGATARACPPPRKSRTFPIECGKRRYWGRRIGIGFGRIEVWLRGAAVRAMPKGLPPAQSSQRSSSGELSRV